MLLDTLFPKLAELDNPPVQAIGYQESTSTTGDSMPVLEYAEPSGGQQLNVAPQINGDLESDPPITLQGEHPEIDAGFYTQQGKTAGDPWSAPLPGTDYHERYDSGPQPGSDRYQTPAEGLGDDGNSELITPVCLGYDPASDMGDPLNSPAGLGIVTAGNNGKPFMNYAEALRIAQDRLNPTCTEGAIVDRMLARLAAELPELTSGAQSCSQEADGRDVLKVASFDQLFSFDRVGTDKLIHKSTHDLWKISTDAEGNLQLEREFNPANIIPG